MTEAYREYLGYCDSCGNEFWITAIEKSSKPNIEGCCIGHGITSLVCGECFATVELVLQHTQKV